ncbi:MAG: diacylglycerol kinase family protein [Bacillus sp. (in: firmicutes)]
MDFREDKHHSFVRSVGFALKGIRTSFQERNMKIHVMAGILAIAAGIALSISLVEWLFILTCIAGVIALEMVNTAIEKVVDLVTGDYHVLAEKAKDLAAGAVLVYAIYAAAVGLIIFLPKMIDILYAFWK